MRIDLIRLSEAVVRIESGYKGLHDLVVIEDRNKLNSVADELRQAAELVRAAAVEE